VPQGAPITRGAPRQTTTAVAAGGQAGGGWGAFCGFWFAVCAALRRRSGSDAYGVRLPRDV